METSIAITSTQNYNIKMVSSKQIMKKYVHQQMTIYLVPHANFMTFEYL